MSPLKPVALTPCLPAELLSYVLQQTSPTAVIICRPRAAFLSSLLNTLFALENEDEYRCDFQSDPEADPEEPLSPPEFPMTTADEDDAHQPRREHPLLIPTLQQISRSRQTNMAYVSSVSHLRAYLSVFPSSPLPSTSLPEYQSFTPSHVPLLIIYGLVELHRETSEWSTQGLGITLAAVVDAASMARRGAVLVEEWMPEPKPAEHYLEEGDEDMENEEGSRNEGGGMQAERRGTRGIWHDRLPILSGGVRRPGADSDFGGRTVEVGIVMSRWFNFRRGDWDDSSRV